MPKGIMIMLLDPIDTQLLSQDSLILLFDITSDYTKYIKKVFIRYLLVSDSGRKQ